MTRGLPRPTVPRVTERFIKQPLRLFGLTALTVVFVVSLTTEPGPGLHGDGPWVILGLVLYVVGIVASVPAREIPDWQRIGGLALVAAAAVVISIVQPNGAMVGAVYYVVIVAAMALEARPALLVSAAAVAAE